jgi:hypothetical protein
MRRRWGVNLLNLLIGATLMWGVLEGVAYAVTCWEETSQDRTTLRTVYCTICCLNLGTPAAECTRSCRQ